MTDYSFKPLVFEEISPTSLGEHGCPLTLPEPDPRSGHRSVCDDGNMFSFGGYQRTGNIMSPHKLYEELWCFNFAENTWKFLPTTGDTPQELASHCAFLFGNYLNVFGGTGVNFGETISNTLTRLDLRTLRWEVVIAKGDPPDPQYGQAIILDEVRKHLYVIGGTDGYEYTMDVHRLDLGKSEWEVLFKFTGDHETQPLPRYRHEVAFDGQNIYVFGGGTATDAFTMKIVFIFNISKRNWRTMKTKKSRVTCPVEREANQNGEGTLTGIGFPLRRKCHSAVQLGDDLFICGGCSGLRVYQDLWKFNLPTRQWHYLPVHIPIPLAFHSACVTSEGCMYVFGGVTDIEQSLRTNKVYKIWLKVPKLQEICWESMLKKFPILRFLSRKELIEAGIPWNYANRLHPSPPSGKPDESVESVWESDLLKCDKGSCMNPATEQGCTLA